MLRDHIRETPTMAEPRKALSLRTLPWCLAALGATTCAPAAWAVEMGRIDVLSSQGAPLYAHFELRDVMRRDWDTLDIVVQPGSDANDAASAAALQGAKIRWQRPLKGRVAVAIEGFRPYEASRLPVTVVVRWGSGEIKRSFDLEFPQVAKDAPLVIYRNDTLSELMITHRYGQGTLAQRMIATQRANPGAFIGNNIHRILAGKSLSLPTTNDILSVDAAEAEALVKAQWAEFDAYRRSLATRTQTIAQTDNANTGAVDRPVSGQASAKSGDRLSVTQGQTKQEQALATQQALAAEAERQSELHNNLKDLKAVAKDLPADASSGASVERDAVPDSTLNEPAWVTAIKAQPWLMPLTGVVLACLALLVWLRRSRQRINPADMGGSNHGSEPTHAASDITETVEVMDPPPQLRPQYTLDKLIPDIDLELPPLDMPEVDGERLLEEAKAALRAGDSEKARALALEALESRDPLIQSNAKALLERI